MTFLVETHTMSYVRDTMDNITCFTQFSRQEELRLIEAKRQKDARKLQEERKMKMEADKAMEWERAQDLARQEELRRQQSQQLEALRMKAVKQQERATAKVEIKQYSSTAMR